jgi:hypothetical protein
LHTIATQAYPGLTAQHTSAAIFALYIGPTTALTALQAIVAIAANNDIANTTPTECTNTVVDKLMVDMMELPHLIIGPDEVEWIWSTANEFGHLTKGVQPHMPKGSQTMRFIYHHELPKGQKTTYSRFVASERPYKVELKRARICRKGAPTILTNPKLAARLDTSTLHRAPENDPSSGRLR